VLVALVVAVFGPAVSYGFLPYDDDTNLLENPTIRHGLDGASLKWAFGFQAGYQYHPLTWLSHALDFSAFGDDPAGHHAVSVALHALSTAFLFLFLSRTTGARGPSVLVAALFGIHPLRAESVVWVAERKDVLSVFLAIVLLVAYAAWSGRPTPARRAGIALIFLAGLLAKPMLVTLPVLLLLLDVWPLHRLPPGEARFSRFLGLVLEKLPLFVLSAAAAVVTVFAQRASGALATLETSSVGQRIAVALHAVAWYVRKTLLPEGLSIFYPLEMPGPGAIAAGAATLALFLGLALHPRVHPAVRIGVLWYLVALAPVSGLVRIGDQLVADRYSYLPSVGLLVAVVFGLGSLLPDGRRPVLVAVATASLTVVASFAIAASADATRFRDGLTLFTSALESDPRNWLAHVKVGDELVRRGRGPEAVPHYAAAFRLRPEWDGAAGNLGQALASTGRIPEALAVLDAGLRRNPSSEWLHRVAAVVYGRAGDGVRASELRAHADALRALPVPGGTSPSKENSLRRARGEASR
jgi:tetratricopeptide (TPR) repeat protein